MSNIFVYTDVNEYDVIDGVNHYIPVIVFENIHGYTLCKSGEKAGSLPYYWGTTRKECQDRCNKMNEEMMFSKEDVLRIISSSMRAHKDVTL
ncbi:MAG: hypothetical protein CXT67_00200 [Methanobacteriota archaeon]|nr:MAG: hypothetical protein CXT67_00200 [Euryarchaeota archaeon]